MRVNEYTFDSRMAGRRFRTSGIARSVSCSSRASLSSPILKGMGGHDVSSVYECVVA